MTSTLLAAVGVLVLVAGIFLALWIVDAHRADDEAADPQRVPDHRWWSRSGRGRS